MTFPSVDLDENDTFHLGTFDAVRGNFTAASERGSPFHSLEALMIQTPFTDMQAAVDAIKSYNGSPEDFTLPIADNIQDPMGMYMTIITDNILAKGWEPNGFEQRESYRIYRYKKME